MFTIKRQWDFAVNLSLFLNHNDLMYMTRVLNTVGVCKVETVSFSLGYPLYFEKNVHF